MRKSCKLKTIKNIYKKINKLFNGCSCKNRTFHKKTRKTRKSSKSSKTRKSSKRMRGGNYAKDATITEIDGVESKSLDKITVAIPGSVMSGSAYKKHMEYLEMNGTDIE